MDDKEKIVEKEYLIKTKKIINELIKEMSENIGLNSQSIIENKKFLWENMTDYTDEELISSMNEVDLNTNIVNKNIEQMNRLNQALKSPYFSKVVFNDEDLDEIMDIYIGICGVSKDYDCYVYDWRSPISSLFYNYEVGKASYEAPIGNIEGEILSKTQFKIQDGELIRCFNSDLNIDDDFLQEILATSSTDKMKNIVSTIQREQNEVIRNISDKYLIVQGVAGSGKTSVALHRIAYLMYKNKNLLSNNILIFSPNDVFSDYISNVLPELGEQNVLTTTFTDFANFCLKPYKNIESYTEFLERVYSKDVYNQQLIKDKLSYEYKNKIQEFLDNKEENIELISDLKLNNYVIDKNKIKNLYLTKYKKFPYIERIELLAEDVCNMTRTPLKNKNKVKTMISKLLNLELNQFNLYKEFLKNNNIEKDFMKNNKINYEDIMGLMYIYFKIHGYPNYRHIQQVLIDEAQDYTYFQMELLKQIFPNARFTILGDINQTINPFYKYASMENLNEIFSDSKYIELKKAYRSSEEIINYTNKILNISNIIAVRKENNFPINIKKINEENDIGLLIKTNVQTMKQNGMKKIAIITKNIEEATEIYNLINSEEIQLIKNNSDIINNDVIIIPSYLSKGLEFEGVIVYNNKVTYCEEDINLYYVVCSRAQHMLSIYNEPKKILKK